MFKRHLRAACTLLKTEERGSAVMFSPDNWLSLTVTLVTDNEVVMLPSLMPFCADCDTTTLLKQTVTR